MYMCKYVYTYIYIYIFIQILHICTYTYIHMWYFSIAYSSYTCNHTHTYIHICICIHTQEIVSSAASGASADMNQLRRQLEDLENKLARVKIVKFAHSDWEMYVCVYMYVCIYIYMCVYVYMYVCIYIYTYIWCGRRSGWVLSVWCLGVRVRKYIFIHTNLCDAHLTPLSGGEREGGGAQKSRGSKGRKEPRERCVGWLSVVTESPEAGERCVRCGKCYDWCCCGSRVDRHLTYSL
jgi:hypothetical protein